jgi:hypothetical protein
MLRLHNVSYVLTRANPYVHFLGLAVAYATKIPNESEEAASICWALSYDH